MSDLQRYIVEEWAEEFYQGRLPRREFLRRMAIMAGSAALAVPLLQSVGVAATQAELMEALAMGPQIVAQATGVTVPPTDPAIEVSDVTYPRSGGGDPNVGYLARPRGAGSHPGVIVIHENRGLLEHFKDVARRFAREGYVALAVDLVATPGGTARLADSAQATAALGQTPPDRLVSMLRDAFRHIQEVSGIRRDRIGAIGWCFGGGMTWRLATQESGLRAAAPFYGPNPPIADVPNIRAAVLAIYGALDERINAGIPQIREALQRANVVHEIHIYPNAPHAFFNDTGGNYRREAAEDAWRRVLAWFERHLKA
ncbi:MAG: dienelactone hydrolase family protein [Armatimonadota bacterium]|nr:dienelactone hydrolase family protein [Armatimonadota bacterium]MDR7453964.1 dienelactone hydrolase family protein [Armatimonadota bacterium]MDR7511987.1 dienelactone hydrolase family protein [Armatimonadota bacterium]